MLSKTEPRILYIEDDPDTGALFKSVIKDQGYFVDVAICGRDGLELHASNPYDVVAVDYKLPDMSGIDVCKILLGQNRDLPVMMVTGKGNELLAAEALSIGVSNYIVKDNQNVYLDLIPSIILQLLQKAEQINDRQLAAKSLEEREALFDAVLGASQNVIIVKRLSDGKIRYCNDATAKLFGYQVEELIGQKSPGFYHDPIERESFLEKLQKDGFIRNREVIFSRADGAPISTLFNAKLVIIGDEPHMVANVTDLSEYKKVEESLRISQERNALAMEGVNDGMWDWDIEKDILNISPRYQKILGLENRPSIRTRDWLKFVHPEDVDRFKGGVASHLKGETEFFTCDFRLVVDDKQYWVHDRGKALIDAGGRAYRMAGSMGDITDRKKIEVSLKENEEMLRTFLDATADYAALITPEAEICIANQAMADIFGVSQEELVGKPMFANPPTETGKRRMQWVKDVVHTRLSLKNVDQHEGRWFDSSYYPVLNDDGDVVRIAIFARDITIQKQLEKALKESEAKFRDIAESASDYFWSTDDQHRIIWESERVDEIAGLSFARVKGMTRWELPGPVKGDMEFWGEFVTTLDSHEPFRDFEFPYAGLDEEIYTIRISGVPFFEEDKFLGYRGAARDVTGIKKAEQELKAAKEQAEIAGRAKSDLIANMSHELRTPLNAIIGFSSTMKEETFGPIDNEKYREYLEFIDHSGKHLLELINDILDVSAIEAGALELHEEKIVPAKIVEGSLNLIRPRADEGKVTLSSTVTIDLPLIFVDERRVKQVLLNLLSNAVKFTPEGGEVSISANENIDGTFSFHVADSGIGMDPKELRTALSTFGQVDSGLDRKHEGTGLGLPLTRGLMDLHGGSMDVKSAKGQGTMITVTFPSDRVL